MAELFAERLDRESTVLGRGADGDADERLVVDIDGYEGPLDLLLDMARAQKVDLSQISILQLAEQYLSFIEAARRVRLELAADYLVMAAWLAYLKSRLLLPKEDDEQIGPDELADRLGLQLRRLEAMRERGAEIMSRYRQGRDVFARGLPEGVSVLRRSHFNLSLYELLSSYAVQRGRVAASELHIERGPLYSIEDAIRWLERMVGSIPDWTSLEQFLPPLGAVGPRMSKSAVASTFAAVLEMARQGRVELQQGTPYSPIMVRAREGRDASEL